MLPLHWTYFHQRLPPLNEETANDNLGPGRQPKAAFLKLFHVAYQQSPPPYARDQQAFQSSLRLVLFQRHSEIICTKHESMFYSF